MLEALFMLAAEAHEETSKTAFYVVGSILAGWAVIVAAMGLSRENFPANQNEERGVVAVSVVLVLATMVSAIATG